MKNKVRWIMILNAVLAIVDARGVSAQGNTVVVQSLAAADRAMAQGTLHFVRSMQGKGRKSALTVHSLTYDDNLRFIQRTVASRDTRSEQTELYDGKDHLLVFGKTVIIKSDRPDSLNASFRTFDIYPGPSYVLGRGLSSLKDIHVTKRGSLYSVEGTAPDATRISALVDPAHEYIATRIERRTAQGILVGRVNVGKPIRFGDGPSIASSSEYQAYQANGTLHGKVIFHFSNARFTDPGKNAFTLPFKKGMTILDTRLGVTLAYEKTLPGNVTPEQLLKTSQERLQKQVLIEQQHRQADRLSKFENYALLLLPLFILLGWRYVQSRRRRASSILQ